MKLTLLSLSLSLVATHVVPLSQPRLEIRVGQQLTNPENEPDYVDPVTGATTPKTRVLSGVGPAEADQRWFDWDESCTDEAHRTKILTTFQYTMELAEWTSTHLEELLAGLPNVPGKSINRDNQRYIFQQDPAYAQMFCGYDNRIAAVKDIYDRVISKGKGPPAMREEGGPGALRFICNAENRVLGDDQSTPLCGTGEGATQAQALIPYKPGDGLLVEPKYAFEQSSSITFCPKFFTDFPNIDGVVGSGDYTLDKVDCLERILLHEYMHLPWVGDMPGDPDKIGYYNAADFAKKNTWGAISIHAENFAWLALYAYFNGQGCKTDSWPSGVKKPNTI